MGEAQDPAELFGTVPLFRGLGRDELTDVAKLSKRMEFKGGETIVKEGDAGLGFYVIVKGAASVKRKGREVAKLGRGSFFGEMSLLDSQPRSADVVATEPTTCLVLLRWNFWSLVSKNKNVVRGLLEEMARRLRASNEALSE
ncbi:MAG TPA: cyclic nucleotide-binding domain-containing protein [Nitrososphaerales archaeon]